MVKMVKFGLCIIYHNKKAEDHPVFSMRVPQVKG